MPDEQKIDPHKMRFIEAKARELAKTLDAAIHQTITGGTTEHRFGFALMIFAFDTPELTYISNAQRDDMRKMLRELLDRWEANDWSEFAGGFDAQN